MRRRLVVAAVAVAAVALAVRAASEGGGGRDAAAATAPAATATVVRTDLVQVERLDGTLGYGELDTGLVARGAGTVTWLAPEGSTVEPGGVLFELDGRPVVLLAGEVPAHRDLVRGMRGDDVRQLKENLVALGHATWAQIGDDDRFGAATSEALRRLQAAVGADRSGVLLLGDAAFLPAAVRVGAHATTVGTPVADGAAVAALASTERVVTIRLPAGKRALVAEGDAVDVELPSGGAAAGTVRSVADVADAPEEEGGEATVEVVVVLDDPGAAGGLDQAPVDVAIETDRRDGVLAVPVTALLALAEGGYGVEVVDDGRHRLVAVETGMFSDRDDLVEITGGDVAEGDEVVVPR